MSDNDDYDDEYAEEGDYEGYEEGEYEGDEEDETEDTSDLEDDEGFPENIFVGSLSFQTTIDDLTDHLENLKLKPMEVSFFEQDGKSKGCALVKFETEEEAQSAINKINHTTLNEREIFAREDRGPRRPRRRRRRIEIVDETREPADPTFLYVGNIVYSVTSEELRDLFSHYGNVVEATVSQQRRNKKSLGWGIVQFETKEQAAAALDLNNTEFRDRALRVEALEKAPMRGRKRNRRGRNMRISEKDNFKEDPCHLYVGNLAWSVVSEELREEFSEFGEVIHAEVAKDRNGRSRGWGSVEFKNKDDAAAAMEELQGKDFFERPFNIQVRLAFGKGTNRVKKSPREESRREPRGERELRRRETRALDRLVDNPKCHLFVGNLPWSVDDDDLAELFSTVGEVADAVVTKDPRSKRSRGWGTVEMVLEEDADRAIEELHEYEHLERRLLVRYDSFVKTGHD